MTSHTEPVEQQKRLRPPDLDNVCVGHRDNQRVVHCFCGQEVIRSIVPHLKNEHPELWTDWVNQFVTLRSSGYPLKAIMRLFRAGNGPLLFSWTVVERAIRQAVEGGSVKYVPTLTKTVKQWEPEDFQPSSGTIWNFPKRGSWAVHSGDYRGNWPPQLVRNLLLTFTDPGDLIVDPFVGGGTTLIEAWLSGRHSIGTDISKLALQTTRAKLRHMAKLAHSDPRVHLSEDLRPRVVSGDALRLERILLAEGIPLGSVKLLCVHPPYLDSVRFTQSDQRDFSQVKEPEVFYSKLSAFAQQAMNVLADNGVCALLMGDVRKTGRLIPLGFNSADVFALQGFTLESIIIKAQNRERSTEFYRTRGGHFLLEHEYLFIFRKELHPSH